MKTVPSSIWCREPHLTREACGRRTWAGLGSSQGAGSGSVRSISRQTVSMSILTCAIDARPDSQVISAECQVCSMTRTAELFECRVLQSHRVQDDRRREPRDRVHLGADAAVGEGQGAHHRVRQMRFTLHRAEGPHQGVGDPFRRVVPAGGRLRSVPCMCWSWSCMVATSRWTLDGK